MIKIHILRFLVLIKDKKSRTIGRFFLSCLPPAPRKKKGPTLKRKTDIIYEKYVKKPKCIPLSANTLVRCIENVAEDLNKQYQNKFCSVGGLLYSCKSIEVSNMSQYLLYSLLIIKSKKNKLFFELLEESCTGEDIINSKLLPS